MKESINNALILTLVITFLFIFVVLFAGSTSYTKAFKVKNRIISIIEKNEDIIIKNGISGVIPEIELTLKDAGYKIVSDNNGKCKKALEDRFLDSEQTYKPIYTGSTTYRYCIAEFSNYNKPGAIKKGRYYAVITYMYFEIPLIGAHLEFPVYGETKVLGINY